MSDPRGIEFLSYGELRTTKLRERSCKTYLHSRFPPPQWHILTFRCHSMPKKQFLSLNDCLSVSGCSSSSPTLAVPGHPRPCAV